MGFWEMEFPVFGIPKEATYGKYGDAARKIEMRAIGGHGDFARMPYRKYRMGGIPNRRKIFYAVGNRPISAGRAKTGAYVGENRKLDVGFRVKDPQELAETNESSPMVQLQILMVELAVIAYRKWNFREMAVSMAFLRYGPLKRENYVKLPDGWKRTIFPGATETAVWDEYCL